MVSATVLSPSLNLKPRFTSTPHKLPSKLHSHLKNASAGVPSVTPVVGTTMVVVVVVVVVVIQVVVVAWVFVIAWMLVLGA